MRSYLDLIVKRASGELQTAAKWMRTYVDDHPEYQHDSIVPQSVAHDLLRACHDVGVGTVHVPELLGVEPIAPVVKENAYNVQLAHVHLESKDDTLAAILERYAERARLVERRTQVMRLIVDKTSEIKDLQAELAAINAELEPTSHNNNHNHSPTPAPSVYSRSAPQLDVNGLSKSSGSASDLLGLDSLGRATSSRTGSQASH